MAPVTALFDTLAGSHATVAPGTLGRLATRALRDEATLTPKPGLVDMRGGGPHDDMDVTTLLASADALTVPIVRCAEAAVCLPLGRDLRAEIGAIGRAGEQRMLRATGGVNTHRGALWVLGLLAAGLAATGTAAGAAVFAARLAGIEDPALPARRAVTRRAGSPSLRRGRRLGRGPGGLSAHDARRAAGVTRRARGRPWRAHRAHRRSPGVDGEARRYVPAAPRRTRRFAGRAPAGGRDPERGRIGHRRAAASCSTA